LHCDRKNQSEIAEQLGLLFGRRYRSQASVSRLLSYCRTRRWLVESAEINWDRVSESFPALRTQIDQYYFSRENLLKWVKEKSPYREACRLHIVRAEDADFTRDAAAIIRQFFQPPSRDQLPQVVGIAWGQTILRLIEEVVREKEKRPDLPQPRPLVVPLCGEPIHLRNRPKDDHRIGSTDLAVQFREWLYGGSAEADEARRPSLRGVAAYVGDQSLDHRHPPTHKSAADSVREFMKQIDGYVAIFGGDHPPAEKLDMVLTGAGYIAERHPEHSRHPMGSFIEERLAQHPPLTPEDLARDIIGDLAGVLISRDSKKQDSGLITCLNEGWIGLQLNHLKRCCESAALQHRPGVVVVARHEYKAVIIKALIERGLVLNAIISKELADELEKLAGAK
jgi:DNA-binding transcriptional regulator LsrR (DeoR family)